MRKVQENEAVEIIVERAGAEAGGEVGIAFPIAFRIDVIGPEVFQRVEGRHECQIRTTNILAK